MWRLASHTNAICSRLSSLETELTTLRSNSVTCYCASVLYLHLVLTVTSLTEFNVLCCPDPNSQFVSKYLLVIAIFYQLTLAVVM